MGLGFAVRKICKYAGISASFWYKRQSKNKHVQRPRQKRPLNASDQEIIQHLKSYRQQKHFRAEGGYRKLSAYLRRDYQLQVNHKRVYRLARIAGVLLQRTRRKIYKAKLKSAKRLVYAPNQLWQFDIKYCYISGENRFCYLCVFIDVFTRKIVNFHIGLSCTARDILNTLHLALKRQNVSCDNGLYIRSDNGPQMSSRAFSDGLKSLPVTHEFIPCRSPNDNAFVEAFHSQIEIGCLSAQEFNSYGECYQEIVCYIEFYNHKRIHGSLKMTPSEFENRVKMADKQDLNTHLISA